MFTNASSNTVRLRRPKKSIFRSPSFSQGGWSNCVITAPSSSRRMIGITSISGSADMITPAAWTPHWRLRFSRPRASSKIFAESESLSNASRNSAASLYLEVCSACLSAGFSTSSPNEISLPSTMPGMSLVSFSPAAYGIPKTLAESLRACFALMVPKVTICATRSSPYF